MPNILKRIWLRLRMSRRVGAFIRARKQGLSTEEARAYSDRLYPPTAEEAAFEAELRNEQLRKDQAAANNPALSAGSNSDREWIVGEFRKRAQMINRSDEAGRFAFSTILAMYWKAFLAVHESPAKFAELPRNEQMDYYKKWLAICADLGQREDWEKLIPAEIVSYYLAAIINKDREFEVEVAKFCDEYASKGWNLAG